MAPGLAVVVREFRHQIGPHQIGVVVDQQDPAGLQPPQEKPRTAAQDLSVFRRLPISSLYTGTHGFNEKRHIVTGKHQQGMIFPFEDHRLVESVGKSFRRPAAFPGRALIAASGIAEVFGTPVVGAEHPIAVGKHCGPGAQESGHDQTRFAPAEHRCIRVFANHRPGRPMIRIGRLRTGRTGDFCKKQPHPSQRIQPELNVDGNVIFFRPAGNDQFGRTPGHAVVFAAHQKIVIFKGGFTDSAGIPAGEEPSAGRAEDRGAALPEAEAFAVSFPRCGIDDERFFIRHVRPLSDTLKNICVVLSKNNIKKQVIHIKNRRFKKIIYQKRLKK